MSIDAKNKKDFIIMDGKERGKRVATLLHCISAPLCAIVPGTWWSVLLPQPTPLLTGNAVMGPGFQEYVTGLEGILKLTHVLSEF